MVEQKLSGSELAIPNSLRLYEAAKRIADVFVSLLLIVAFAPILLMVAIWVRLDSKGPIFFRQERIGRQGKMFRIWKFRTMVNDAEAHGPQVTSKNDSRITRSGKVLRAWKLDEFPQLFNVLIGDMSLVGPRPQVPKYVALFPARQRAKVLSVRPGITGPTAIRFRHEEEMLQNRENREQFYIDVLLPIKCDLDEAYIDSRSLSTDFSALWQTGTMLIRGVINRLRRIPVGETVEYPLPEAGAAAFESGGRALAAVRGPVTGSDLDGGDGALAGVLRD